MRRIFLSFLGTTNYFPVNYYSKKTASKVKNVRFVQEALVQWQCSDWGKLDHILIMTTDESRTKNWDDNGHEDRKGNRLTFEGLQTRLRKLSLKAKIQNINIPVGRNEGEIWEIFDTLIEQLKEEDELYLDVTHSFRSLPLLAMVTLNYAKVMKGINVKAIHYGAMEALGYPWEIEKMELEERSIPVFDLLPFDQLLDWSVAIDRFLASGDAKMVREVAGRALIPVLAKCKGQNIEARDLRPLAKNLGEYTEVMATCRGLRISEVANALKVSLERVQHQKVVKPLKPMLKKLRDSVSQFTGNEVNDGIAAARWCARHNLVQQGFTIMAETSTTYIVEQALGEGMHEQDTRDLVNMALKILKNKLPLDDWDEKARAQEKKTQKIIDWFVPQEALRGALKNLTNYRNDLNHAGHKDNPMSANKFSAKLDELVFFFEELIHNQGDPVGDQT
ncbi:MAG: TIGR02221 family CRISPR-associated protein [Desulfobulbaceae bacterium]|nr:TIGR02221 family CRISPR-associated protein [Desulfobulbaceae bacterium]